MADIEAYLDDFGKVVVSVSRRYYSGKTGNFYLSDSNGEVYTCLVRGHEDRQDSVMYELSIPADLSFGISYELHEKYGKIVPLQIRYIVHTKYFDELFTYTGNDLGATYHPGYTDFVLWAPTAVSVVLCVSLRKKKTYQEMRRTDCGVYRARIAGDLKYATYTYLINRNGVIVKSADPYALSSTANGKESAVIDLDEIRKIRDLPASKVLSDPVDAVIYEANVRDLTSNPLTGTMYNGKYLSLTESDTAYEDLPTGLDYLSSLGITHLQLMPVGDYATVDELNPERGYNWGYDPVSWLVPEGSYSTDPDDPYSRMRELRKMVSTLHGRGIRVVFDVVFNHVYDTEGNPLELTVPYYYYRYSDNWYRSNGSYCGNDIESRKPMTKKLFRKVISTWMELYGADGFRFDLMGILDVDTVNELYALAKSIKPDALMYGEGWNMPTALPHEDKAMIENMGKMQGIGHFNDVFRDVLKGQTSDDGKYFTGYLTGNTAMAFDACSALAGHCRHNPYFWRFDEPEKSINAIETHDNLTVWDKMHFCCKEEPRDIRQLRQKMLIACTMFAQGIPFLHAGVEFCASKEEESNSYCAGDAINRMDWERLKLNQKVYEYTKKCIALRRSEPLFRLRSAQDIEMKTRFSVNDGVIIYDLETMDHACKVIINATYEQKYYEYGDLFKIQFDEEGNAHSEFIYDVTVKPHTVVVLKKEKWDEKNHS